MKAFEILDISGDAGIRAFGSSLPELFANAALGMYSLMTNIGRVEEKQKLVLEVAGHSLEGLLVAWLNDLIFRFDTYGFVGDVIVITSMSPGEENIADAEEFSLSAHVEGETFDLSRHERKLLLKAATYHDLTVGKKDGVWTAEIVFDI
jgi:SHS2 domain-containing protein